MMVPSPYIMARGTDYITAAVFTNPCLGERTGGREGGACARSMSHEIKIGFKHTYPALPPFLPLSLSSPPTCPSTPLR